MYLSDEEIHAEALGFVKAWKDDKSITFGGYGIKHGWTLDTATRVHALLSAVVKAKKTCCLKGKP